jgi:hypothetical protein
MQNNQLTGMLPSTMGNFSNLHELDLNNNALSGVIPDLLWSLNLSVLSMRNNNLIGSVPQHLCDKHMGLDSLSWFSRPKIQCDCCVTQTTYEGPDGCLGVELNIVFDKTFDWQNSWSLEDKATSTSIIKSEEPDYYDTFLRDPLRNVKTCISPTNCFDLTTDGDGSYEVFVDNQRIYGPGAHTLISFGYSSEVGRISLYQCSSVQQLCHTDYDMSQSQSTLSRKLDHVLGMPGRKYVVLEFSNRKSAVHRAACSAAAMSAEKLTMELQFDGRVYQRYVLLLLHYGNGAWSGSWPGGIPTDTDACDWNGVQCNDQGFIVTLDLNKQNLSGTLPQELGGLKSLELLSLYENNLSGTIPSSFENLENLRNLSLSNNEFTGRLPSSLPPNIEVLKVDHNFLGGPVPPKIGQLESLGKIKEQQCIEHITIQNDAISHTFKIKSIIMYCRNALVASQYV